MKKTAKPIPQSRIAEGLGLIRRAFDAVTKIEFRVGGLAEKIDKQESRLTQDLANIREQFVLTDEWRQRALRAEFELTSKPPESITGANLEVLKAAITESNTIAAIWEKRARDAESKLESEPVDGATFEFWRSRSNCMEKELAQAEERIAKCAEECEKLRQSSPEEKSKVDSGKSFTEGYWHGREIANAFLQDHVRRHGDGARAIRELAGLTMNAHPSDEKIRNCWCILTVPAGSPNSCTDCGGTGYVIKGESKLESPRHVGFLYRPEQTTCDDNNCWCQKTPGANLRKESKWLGPDRHVSDCPAAKGPEFACNCGFPCDRPKPPESKPLRLLVEVVPKKDERHGTGRMTYPSGISLRVSGPYEDNSAAMSVQELPPMPDLDELQERYNAAYYHDDDLQQRGHRARTHLGMRAVLKACGLEVE